ncbi:MAG: OmpA family protein [Gammaproteobacteria bacterium]|nr:OmpA family protein [Gammaproteobacteria bacterium]
MSSISRLAATALVASAVFASGCTTLDPFTREEQTSNTSTGAAIGALAGAIVGAASGDDAKERKKRALIGAGVGALTGGSIGYYMDVQEAELRKKLEGTGVSVTRDGENIILNMPGNVTFDTDSTNVSESFKEVLESVSLVLEEYEKTLIVVAGHTDSTGSADYNQRLSENRALAVTQVLSDYGVADARFVIIGYGEERPIASNETVGGRAENRRVELTLEPLTR